MDTTLPALTKAHPLCYLLRNFELIEAQLNSIIRGPHLRTKTALELAGFFRRLEQVEVQIRAEATASGLDGHAPMAQLRRDIRALATDFTPLGLGSDSTPVANEVLAGAAAGH